MLALPHGLVVSEPLLYEQLDRLPAKDVAGAPAVVPLLLHYSLVLEPKMHWVVWIFGAEELPNQGKNCCRAKAIMINQL